MPIEKRMWNIITAEKINSLTDQEVFIFDMIVSGKTVVQILDKLNLNRSLLSKVMTRLCFKLEVEPKCIYAIRQSWQNSLALQKTNARQGHD